MTTIRATLAELREFIAEHEAETRVWIAAIWLCVSLAVVTPTLWPWAIFADTVAAAMGLGAWVVVLRTRLAAANDYATEAQAIAASAVDQAETFADEIRAVCAANEVLCAELAAADGQRARLASDLLAAEMRLSDALAEAERAPAPVIPLPVQRDPEHDHLPLSRDEWAAIERETRDYQ